MKTKVMTVVAVLGVLGLPDSGVPRVLGQAPISKSQSEAEMRALLRERGGALDKALENGSVERARLGAERTAKDPEIKARLEEAIKRGRPVPTEEELAAKRRAEAQLERARANLSEQAKLRMTRPIVDPPARALPVTPPADPVKPADFGGAQPKQPDRVNIAPKKETNRVRVTAAGAAEFDSRSGIAIFTEDVVVEHPSFYLECDELEVHMTKDATAGAAAEAGTGDPAPAPAPALPVDPADPEGDGGGQQQSGIEMAIAKGRMVVLKKKSEDGKLQVGHCRYAVFDGKTGDIEMRIWPQIQKDNELLVSTKESTVITIKQDGRLSAVGPVKLVADSKEK